jgi:hypothetical protein
MGQLSPEEIMFLFGAAALAIVVASFIARRFASRGQSELGAPDIAAPPAPRSAEVHTLHPQQRAEIAPSQPAPAPAAPPPAQPSYTAIAVARAGRVALSPAPIAPAARIDYADEATSVPPAASYTAIAVANAARAARGLPPLEVSPAAGNASAAAPTTTGASYAAIAAAAARFTPRAAEQAPHTRIDYSDVPAEILASASYTAIAIAAAARHG